MDNEIDVWRQLYHQQEDTMTTLTIELNRLRNRDRRRYLLEGLATLLVVGMGIYFITVGTAVKVFGGVGMLVLTCAMLVHAVRNVGGLSEEMFAAPKDYARELEARNARELRRLRPLWPIVAVGALCATTSAIALLTNTAAFLAKPEMTISATLAQAAIIGGIVLWRRKELKRLENERAQIVELCSQLEAG